MICAERVQFDFAGRAIRSFRCRIQLSGTDSKVQNSLYIMDRLEMGSVRLCASLFKGTDLADITHDVLVGKCRARTIQSVPAPLTVGA